MVQRLVLLFLTLLLCGCATALKGNRPNVLLYAQFAEVAEVIAKQEAQYGSALRYRDDSTLVYARRVQGGFTALGVIPTKQEWEMRMRFDLVKEGENLRVTVSAFGAEDPGEREEIVIEISETTLARREILPLLAELGKTYPAKPLPGAKLFGIIPINPEPPKGVPQ
jgi:hypothetical protein